MLDGCSPAPPPQSPLHADSRSQLPGPWSIIGSWQVFIFYVLPACNIVVPRLGLVGFIVHAAAVEMHFLLAHSNDKRMAGVVSPVKYLNYEPTQAVHCFCWSVPRIMLVPFVRVILHRLVRTQRPGCYIYNSKSGPTVLIRLKHVKGYEKPRGPMQS